jgi:hypothetical protein
VQNKFEKCLIEQSAPTLAGIKPGSLFNYRAENNENINELLLGWNKILEEKGIRVCFIKRCTSGGLVYVYRPAMLSKLLSNQEIGSFLSSRGFNSGDVNDCMEELRCRFRDGAGFPHEIGIFLGYPLHDVRGFIENKGTNFCLLGMWKVYDDQTLAEKLFAQYKKCKNIYSAMYENGRDIFKLAVSA